MIKILHTSDWHLGHLFQNHDREDEFRYFFDQLYDTVRTEHPDVICISGDIFDTMNPSLGAQNLWAEVLGNLNTEFPDIHVVAIAGNHDSGSKLAVYSTLMRPGIHIVGRDAEVFRFECRDGGVVIAAVPYIPDGHYSGRLARLTGSEPDVEDAMQAYFAEVGRRVAELRREGDPAVMMAHLAVANSDFRGQDRFKFNFYDSKVLGSEFDYTALGHIHFAQNLGTPKMRYSGAPMAMGFDEDYGHSISIVELDGAGCEPRIRTVDLVPLRRALTLPEDEPLAPVDVELFLNAVDKTTPYYLRVDVYNDEDFGMTLRRKIETAFEDTPVRFGYIRLVPRPTCETAEAPVPVLSATDSLEHIDPVDIATRYYRAGKGVDMPERLVKKLKEVTDDNNEED